MLNYPTMKNTAILLLFLIGLTGFGQTRDTICEVSLTVKTTDSFNGTVVPGVNVRLYDAQMKQMAEQLADATGTAVFKVPCGADYTIEVVPERYGGARIPVTVPAGAQEPVVVQARLDAPVGQSPDYLRQFIVTLVNTVQKDLTIRLGPKGNQQPYPVPKSNSWESPQFTAGQPLHLQTNRDGVTSTYIVFPGKIYVISAEGKVYMVRENKKRK